MATVEEYLEILATPLAKLKNPSSKLRMEQSENSSPDYVVAGMRAAADIRAEVVCKIEGLLRDAEERDSNDCLTSKAKSARQRLNNPELNTTLASVAERKAIPNSRLKCAEGVKASEALFAQAAADLQVAYAAQHFEERRAALFRDAAEATSPRSRKADPERPEPEEMTFLHHMRNLGVPISAMDQGNHLERGYIADLLRELALPISERSKYGPWARAFASGQLNVSGAHMTPDEAEAIRCLIGRHNEAAEAAKRMIESSFGKSFDLSPGFALILVRLALPENLEEFDGLLKNEERAERRISRGDIDLILSALGGGMDPQLVRDRLQEAVRLASNLSMPDLTQYEQGQSRQDNEGAADDNGQTSIEVAAPNAKLTTQAPWITDGLELPPSITREATLYYEKYAEALLNMSPSWPCDAKLFWRGYFDKRPDADTIRQALEKEIAASPGAEQITRAYLDSLITDGLDAAEALLRTWGIKWFTLEIATDQAWSWNRTEWGFPQPGDIKKLPTMDNR